MPTSIALLFLSLLHASQGRNILTTIGEMFGVLESGSLLKEPPKGIAVIGAGASRTGTQSLTEALEMLGYPVYNLVGIMNNESHLESVIDALKDRERVCGLLDKVLQAGFTATLDTPMNLFWNETLACFPEGKVVLSVRDSTESWLKSFQWASDVFAPLSHSVPFKWLVDLAPMFDEIGLQLNRLGPDEAKCNSLVSKRFVRPWWAPWVNYQDSQGNSPECLSHYYESLVPTASLAVPKDRLLVFNVKQGWRPLCEFLGVPVPSVPFPNVNSATELLVAYYSIRVICWIYPFLPLIPLLCAYWCCCRRASATKSKSKPE